MRRRAIHSWIHVMVIGVTILIGACSDDDDSSLDGSPPGSDGSIQKEGGADGSLPGDGTPKQDTMPPKPGSLTEVTGFGSNPGNLRMYQYVPTQAGANAPLVVALHGCTENVATHSQYSGWNTMADRKQLYVVYPEQSSDNNVGECFNWFLPGDFSRDTGEAQSIKQMIDWMKSQHSIDDQRVFVTGMSAGAAMAVALLAVYPDVFAGGASMAGIPFGCANDVSSGQTCMGGTDKAPKAWGDLVRAGFPGHSGAYPRIAIFQGTADPMVASSNLTELVEQWTDAHGTDQTPEVNDTISGHSHTVFEDDKGMAVVSAFLLQGMGHGMAVDPGTGPQQGGQAGSFYHPVNLWSCYHAVAFWGI